MPRLLHFSPCVHATVDAFTGRASLMFLLESVRPLAEMEPATGTPEQAQAYCYLLGPFSIFTHWWREEGDRGRTFEQRALIKAPDGRLTVIQPPTRFTLDRPFHRLYHATSNIAIRMCGTYTLVLEARPLQEGVDDPAWEQFAWYPFIVEELPNETETVTPEDSDEQAPTGHGPIAVVDSADPA